MLSYVGLEMGQSLPWMLVRNKKDLLLGLSGIEYQIRLQIILLENQANDGLRYQVLHGYKAYKVLVEEKIISRT